MCSQRHWVLWQAHRQCRMTPSVGPHGMLCSIGCLACRKSRVVCVCFTYVQPGCDHNIPPPGTTPAQQSMTGSCPPVCRYSAPNPHVLTSCESSPFLAPSLYTHIPTQCGEIVVDLRVDFLFHVHTLVLNISLGNPLTLFAACGHGLL